YRQYIEKDAALERRFQKVFVAEPSVEDTIAILRGLKERYELHVAIENLPGRIAANSVIPYPPGIPMLLSGENFGDENSPQVGYL
ncbi:hypothetical protein MJM43_28800, partial [Salmonella enterica subsp. enterica serovar Montevideo]|nr:hypothetical protein [Salmonella enterica subsp. enterica serovar Montevideo]